MAMEKIFATYRPSDEDVNMDRTATNDYLSDILSDTHSGCVDIVRAMIKVLKDVPAKGSPANPGDQLLGMQSLVYQLQKSTIGHEVKLYSLPPTAYQDADHYVCAMKTDVRLDCRKIISCIDAIRTGEGNHHCLFEDFLQLIQNKVGDAYQSIVDLANHVHTAAPDGVEKKVRDLVSHPQAECHEMLAKIYVYRQQAKGQAYESHVQAIQNSIERHQDNTYHWEEDINGGHLQGNLITHVDDLMHDLRIGYTDMLEVIGNVRATVEEKR